MFRDSILMKDTQWEPSVMELADPKLEDVDRYIEFQENSYVRRSMRESIEIMDGMLDDALRCLSFFAELPKEQRETPEIRRRQKTYRDVCGRIGEWRWKCVAAIQVVKFDPLHYLDDNVWKLACRWDEAYFKSTGSRMTENWMYVEGADGKIVRGEALSAFGVDSIPYQDLTRMIQGTTKLFQTNRLDLPINEGK